MAYQDWLPSKAPAWLRRLWGKRWFSSFGLGLDALQAAADLANKARFPEGAPPDAQAATGGERGLPRIEVFGHEQDGAYGLRLKKAWLDLADARTVTGLETILAYIGATQTPSWVTTVFDQQDWNPWYPWSWVWVLVQKPHPWVNDGLWSDPGTWGDGATWGSSATPAQTANLRDVLRPWFGSHNRGWLVVNLTGEIWGEPGTWGDAGTWGGTAVMWPVKA